MEACLIVSSRIELSEVLQLEYRRISSLKQN